MQTLNSAWRAELPAILVVKHNPQNLFTFPEVDLGAEQNTHIDKCTVVL